MGTALESPAPPGPLASMTAWCARHAGWLALAAVVALASALRLWFCAAGPDIDGDAVGHALIGRRLLDEWRDVRVHWVWLPLWHAVHALAVLLGGGIEQVRLANVAVAAVPPFALAYGLRAHLRERPAAAPWLARAEAAIPFAAGAVLALWPIGLGIGASAQPEPLFQALVLGTCVAWERRRPALAGSLLALASMMRYEAWLLPAVFFGLWAGSKETRTARAAQAWLWPGVAVAAWCAVHYAQTHEALQFLRVNREYVVRAHAEMNFPWARDRSVLRSLAWYPWSLPWQDVGPALWLALPGVAWLARRAPWSFRLVPLALLGFVSYAWVRRLHLGLHRHLVVLLPFYAAAVAASACAGAAWLASRVRRASRWTALGPALAAVLLVGGLAARRTLPYARSTVVRHRQARMGARAAAALVRAHAGTEGRVFCDDPAVEVYAALPTRQILRWNGRDVLPYNLWVESRAHRVALVVSAPERVAQLRGVAQTLYDDGAVAVLLQYWRPSPGATAQHR